MKKNKHIGSSVWSAFEPDELEEIELRFQKQCIAEQIREAMKKRRCSRAALAKAMKTSRMVVHRLLDPNDTGLTLATLNKVSLILKMPEITISHRAVQ